MASFAQGMYWMSNVRIGLGESDNVNKTPFVYLKGDITHQDSGGQTQAVLQPAERTVFLYLSDGAMPYTIEKLDKLGFNGDFARPAISQESQSGIWVECSHDLYKGKTKEQWNLPHEGGSFEPQALTNDAVRALNAKYRQMKGGKPAAGPPQRAPTKQAKPAAAPNPAPAAQPDGAVPFEHDTNVPF